MSDLSDRLAPLTEQHREGLEWFLERRGVEIGWPLPMADGLFLLNKAKGIHKPAGWQYALSVRQTMGGPYADRDLVTHPDGSWTYDYFQEGHDPAKRDNDFTNRALIRNMQDSVPIAVALQVTRSPDSRYKIVGLALVDSWTGGYFRLRGFADGGGLSAGASYTPTAIIAEAIESVPKDLTDARTRTNIAIVARQGAGKFRATALNAFNNRCAISRFDVPDALEAAHIVPYLGPDTDQLSNTLLIRADLHTLFDRDLLAIDPVSLKVRLSPALQGSCYADLEGVVVWLPHADTGPWKAALTQRKQPLMQ